MLPLAKAQQGDRQAREELLRQYLPLVLRVATRVTGRWIQVGRDDEVSVGLIALNEAADRYVPNKGSTWIGFAAQVVRRRLIDHMRRNNRYRHEVLLPLTPESEDGDEAENGIPHPPAEQREALRLHQAATEALELREDMERYARRLGEFGIALGDVAALAPKHSDARARVFQAAQAVAQDHRLAAHLCTRRELPVTALEQRVAFSRKTLERQRRIIVAVAILLLEFPDLSCSL